MTLKSKIIQLKIVPKGQGIGYNSKYITPKNMRVAVVPIGYADILPRESSLKLFVYVKVGIICSFVKFLAKKNLSIFYEQVY